MPQENRTEYRVLLIYPDGSSRLWDVFLFKNKMEAKSVPLLGGLAATTVRNGRGARQALWSPARYCSRNTTCEASDCAAVACSLEQDFRSPGAPVGRVSQEGEGGFSLHHRALLASPDAPF